MNVFIEGDRSWFLSKTAVDRFKTDIRGTQSDNFDSVDSSKYLKEGYVFNITKNDNNITAKICNSDELKAENKRKELKMRLKNAQRCRGGEQYKQLESLKRTIPDKIFKSYVNLIKTFGANNIPSPLEVIENPDKFRTQISTVMGTTKPVSNDMRLSNAIKQYFSSLGKFLCIEPANLSLEDKQDIVFNNAPPKSTHQFEKIKTSADDNNDTEDEDEDDEAPKLV
jgi:hypothetical protein